MSKPNWLSLLKGLMNSDLMDKLVDVELRLKNRNERLLKIVTAYIFVDMVNLEKKLGEYDTDFFNEDYLKVVKADAQRLIDRINEKISAFVLYKDDAEAEREITKDNITINTMWGFIGLAHHTIKVLCKNNPHYKEPSEDDVVNYLSKNNDHIKFLLSAPNQDWSPKTFTDDGLELVNRAIFLIDSPKRFFKGYAK